MDNLSLEQALKTHFGHSAFRKPQREVIASLLAGKDTLAIMPTGGGKSLCYQLPALLLDGVTLVVSPLIALMKDQVDALNAKGIAAAMINSSQSWDEQKLALDKMAAGELKLAYIAPERFRAGSFLRTLSRAKISLLAIDEAHCISQWGHDFRPDYMRLGEALDKMGRPLCAAFTATATPEVKEDILVQLKMREPSVFVSGFARPNLHFHIRHVEKKNEKHARVRELVRQHETGIIYCATRKSAEKLSDDFRKDKIRHVLYHGGMTPAQRDKAQEQFMSKKYPVAVATNAFGMGIDRADIRFVCHWEMPGSVEAYYQESGRAGRDGQSAHCEVLFMYADKRVQDFFIDGTNPAPALIRRVYDILHQTKGHDNEAFISMDDLARMATLGQRKSGAANSMAVTSALTVLRKLGLIERFEIPGLRARGTRLLQPDFSARDITIDAELLDEKRRRDEAKLKAFIHLAYSKECRQSWILNYFGETDFEPCGGCDCCDSMKTPATPAPVLVEEEFVEVRKALSGIARMSWRIAPTQWQPRFGRDKVLKSLLGSKDEKIIGAGLDKLSTYGILKPHGKAFANALLKEMEIVGLVEVTQGDYPLLGLTETGARAMLEGGDVFMRYPGELSKLAKKKLKQRVIANANAFHAAQTNGTLTDDTPGKQTKEPPPDYDEELYKKLCSKRNQLRFLRGNVPAYQIFPNAVLQQLAARKPASAQDAMDIKGIGPAKAKSFLPSFLKIIAAHAGS